ncbi:MAG: hypothetical protein NC127_02310 [Muribaculum sp.]|nr:hypothetical protein [Muribaculum sp.]
MRGYINIVILILIVAAASAKVDAKDRGWRHLTIDDGLLSNHVHSIDADKDGIMWMATRYGLASFDGNKVATFLPLSAHTNPKIYNDVLDVCASDSGKIYFVTALAFGIYDKWRDRFSVLRADEGDQYRLLTPLRSGEILVSGASWLSVYNPLTDQYRTLCENDDIILSGVSDVMEDRIGQIWIGTDDSKLLRYSPGEDKIYDYP